MSTIIWTLKFRLHKKDTECFTWKSFDMSEARDIVRKLKSEIKKRGLMPTNTWVLEYGFTLFEEEYKRQGYTLMELSVSDTRKKYGEVS